MGGLARRLSEFEDGIRDEVERLVKIELHLMLEKLECGLDDEELFLHICRLLTAAEYPVRDPYQKGARETSCTS
jgi:hypothetical protein